jgi:hypothetical protein
VRAAALLFVQREWPFGASTRVKKDALWARRCAQGSINAPLQAL